jgi:hypothetical protein
MKSRYLIVLLAITACICQGLAEDSNKQTEKYEEGAGRKTPMSLSACSNCMYNRNGTCCGASCCPAGSLCCTSAYSSASSCCDATLYQCGIDGTCELNNNYNPSPTYSSNFYNWQVLLFIMWVAIMLCAGICRVCARYRRRAVIEINQPDNGAVIVVRPNERAPLLMFPQGGQPGRITAAKKGLTTRQIMALPTKIYSAQDFLKEGADVDCVICLCEYKEGDLIRILLCGHHYHAQCIDKWFLENSVCCLCKMDHSHL